MVVFQIMSNPDLIKYLADKVEKQGWHIEELERKQSILVTSVILIAVYLAWSFFSQGTLVDFL